MMDDESRRKIKSLTTRLLVKFGQSMEFKILAAIQMIPKNKISSSSIYQL
jgi:hypothetical protein